MQNITLTLNGRKFRLGYRLLAAIAANFPAGEQSEEQYEQYHGIALAILSLGVPSLTEKLIACDALPLSTLHELWQNGPIQLHRRLLENRRMVATLTIEEAECIIRENDRQCLMSLARLSPLLPWMWAMRDGITRTLPMQTWLLLGHMRRSEYQEVKRILYQKAAELNLFGGPFPPPSPLEAIACRVPLECISFRNLQPDELPLVMALSNSVLTALARAIDSIAHDRVRESCRELLSRHQDPAIRLAMIEGAGPLSPTLSLLAGDAEPDVASLAARRLECGSPPDAAARSAKG